MVINLEGLRPTPRRATAKQLVEAGLYLKDEISFEESWIIAAIMARFDDISLRLNLADFLEKHGCNDEALVLRLVAANKAIPGDAQWCGFIRNADDQPALEGEDISYKTHRYERLYFLSPGRWSVARRITNGTKGGSNFPWSRWERVTINVQRVTEFMAILDDGKRIHLKSLSACIRLPDKTQGPPAGGPCP